MHTCQVCGKTYDKNYFSSGDFCSNKCYKANYWLKIIEEYNKPNGNIVVINGECYTIGREDEDILYRGSGGKHFKIRFNDGRVVETTNLYCNETVPVEYIDVLKSNAEFC